MKKQSLPSFDAELQLTRDMKQHGLRIFDGNTTALERKARVRSAITTANLGHRVIARTLTGTQETFAAAFARIYGEPLIPPEPEEDFAC